MNKNTTVPAETVDSAEGPRLISDNRLRGEILKMPAYGEESLQFKLIHDLAVSRAWAETVQAQLAEAVELLRRCTALTAATADKESLDEVDADARAFLAKVDAP